MTPAAIVSKLWNFCNVKCVTILLADILRLRCAAPLAIEGGLYGSTSEAIRAGLRLLEEREMKLKILRKALIQGEQSGPAHYSLEDLNRELDEALD
jgi:antitoxin ParD1/3/4